MIIIMIINVIIITIMNYIFIGIIGIFIIIFPANFSKIM